MEEDKKCVARGWFEVAWGYRRGKGVEGLWIVSKVVNVENGFRIRKIELREVCIETCSGRAEIWDSC